MGGERVGGREGEGGRERKGGGEGEVRGGRKGQLLRVVRCVPFSSFPRPAASHACLPGLHCWERWKRTVPPPTCRMPCTLMCSKPVSHVSLSLSGLPFPFLARCCCHYPEQLVAGRMSRLKRYGFVWSAYGGG